MINRDTKVALLILAVTVALYLSLSSIDPEATIFIRVVIVAIGALSLLLMAQGMLLKHRGERGGVAQDSASKKAVYGWKPVAYIFGAILVYFFVMERLGFYISAFLYFVGVVSLLDWGGLTLRKGFVRIAIAFLFIAVIYLLFSVILQVQTPRGLLI
ncbi:MAG: tripartite tricarboxylate transporter TctB family protein [Deltaproteobacteria bacterium]|nr:tripartite tricarboxylate transporter TctB family protein [Deltaproteobacteria bacterium]